MSPIVTALFTGIVASLLSGFLNGWMHYQLKPRKLGRVGAYTTGSLTCLFFAFLAVFATDTISRTTAWGVLVIFGLVYAVSGAVVWFCYVTDTKASNKRIPK